MALDPFDDAGFARAPAAPLSSREVDRQSVIAARDLTARIAADKAAEEKRNRPLKRKILEGTARVVGAKAEAAEPTPPSPQAKALALDKNDAILNNIAYARSLIGPYSTGLPGQVLGKLNATQATDLRNALTNITAPSVIETLKAMKAQSKTGASGFGALSEKELKILEGDMGLLLPNMSPMAMQRALSNVETHYKKARAYMNNEDANSPEVMRKYSIPTLATDPRKGKQELTSDKAVDAKSALYKGLNGIVGSMVSEGADASQIRSYLDTVQPGLGAKAKNVEEVVSYVKSNPGATPAVDIEQFLQPVTGLAKTTGAVGASPVGAGVVGAADILSGGFLPAISGDEERTKAVMEGLQRQYPGSTMAGQFAGSAALGLGGEALLAARGYGRAAPIMTDALLGAYQGAGAAEPGSGYSGAATGAALGTGLGILGRGAMNVAGSALRGVQDPDVLRLSEAGIRMTPGQLLGGRAKQLEDVLEKYPVIGNAAAERRRESLEDFNRRILDERLAPLGATTGGEIGHAGFTIAERHVKDAYDNALNGISIMPDAELLKGVQQVGSKVQSIPRVGLELRTQLNDLIGPLIDPTTGEIPGKYLQTIVQEITKLTKAYENDPLSSSVSPVLKNLREEFEGAMERQYPDNAILFKNANETYGNLASVADAINMAPANAGGVFTPAAIKRATVKNTKMFGGKAKAARGEYPSQPTIEAGAMRLPSDVGDSGTAGRMLVPLALGSALSGGSAALRDQPEGADAGTDMASNILVGGGLMGLLGAPYSRTGRAAIQRTLTAPRNRVVTGMADLVSKYAASVPGRALTPDVTRGFLYDPASRIDPAAAERLPANAVPLPPAVKPFSPEPAAAPMELGEQGSYDPETGIVTLPDGTEIQVDQPAAMARGGLATMPRVQQVPRMHL
jgi:hypothetical protein